MRLLLGSVGDPGRPVGTAELERLYAVPPGPWLRTNFVSTQDGAATGADGLSGSINNAADKVVYDLLRSLADVVLVGERTARAEGYRAPRLTDGTAPVLALLSNHANVPPLVVGPDPGRGRVVLITRTGAPAARLDAARLALGADNVWTFGDERVDLAQAKAALAHQGWPHILCEGGPTLNAALLAAGLVDDLAQTFVPTLVAGGHPRTAHGPEVDVRITLRHLLEEDSTLLGLWRVER